MLAARSLLSSELRRRLTPLCSNGRRGFAADAHGEVKVNAWEAPTSVSKWKEEQIVIAVLGGWGIGIYSALKIFGGGKKEEPAEAAKS